MRFLSKNITNGTWLLIVTWSTLKILGGGLGPIVKLMGLARYHGPIGGVLITTFLTASLVRLSRQSAGQLRPGRLSPIFWALLASVLAAQAWEIVKTPIRVEQSDMIPMVIAGLEDFVRGINPYHPRILEGNHTQPGLYLPGVWLPYLPSYLIGLDIRWTNLMATVCFFWIVLDLSRIRKVGSNNVAFVLALATIGFSKVFKTQPASSHLVLFESLYPLVLWATLRKRFLLASWLTAWLVNSREIAAVLVLPLLSLLFFRHRLQFFQFIWKTALVTAVLNGPFWLWAGHHFWDQIREYHRTFGMSADGMLAHWGALGILTELGVAHLGRAFQCIGLLALTALGSRARHSASALALGGIAWLWVVVWMPSPWAYLYIQPILLSAVLVGIAPLPGVHERR